MERNKAYVISPDRSTDEVIPGNLETFELEDLQQFVGGYIQIIDLFDGRIMVINEEGKILHLEENPKATAIALNHNAIFPFDYIVGKALICPSEMVP